MEREISPRGFRRRVALMLLATALLIGGGLYSTFYTMKQVALPPEKGLFLIERDGGICHLEILGLEQDVDLDRLWRTGRDHYEKTTAYLSGAYCIIKDKISVMLNSLSGRS